MTQKQAEALDKIIAKLLREHQESFREVAEYVISLGYMPTLKGRKKSYVDFSKSKINRTILKIDAGLNAPKLAVKFFAIPVYSGVFEDTIKERLAYWNKLGYEVHCFACGKCNGTQGYAVGLPDGKQGFLCGFGVVPLPSFCDENIKEVKEALKIQDEFFVKQAVV